MLVKYKIVVCALIFTLVSMLSVESQSNTTSARVTISLATSEDPRPEVYNVNRQVREINPGWFVELSREAADQCGANVEFEFAPWPRVLEYVKQGKVSAAFNSSFKPERAAYGVYPRNGIELDKSRASRSYAYYLYKTKGSTNTDRLDRLEIKGLSFVVEAKSSIIPLLIEKGALITEVASFKKMLKIVSRGRVDGAVGIGHGMDSLIETWPEFKVNLIKVKKPIQERIGFVMFSKVFYEKYPELAECFWSSSANLRKTEWFKSMMARYN